MSGARPVPVADEISAPFWAATARHELALARCSRCGTYAHPPDVVCPRCGSADPDFRFASVDGDGVIRSWTVMRQSFLPGFDVPFVLVDVELDAQPDLRLIGRLMSGETPGLRQGARVRLAFEDLASDVAIPAFELQEKE
jgi:uncharacterized OB-fold protein